MSCLSSRLLLLQLVCVEKKYLAQFNFLYLFPFCPSLTCFTLLYSYNRKLSACWLPGYTADISLLMHSVCVLSGGLDNACPVLVFTDPCDPFLGSLSLTSPPPLLSKTAFQPRVEERFSFLLSPIVQTWPFLQALMVIKTQIYRAQRGLQAYKCKKE